MKSSDRDSATQPATESRIFNATATRRRFLGALATGGALVVGFRIEAGPSDGDHAEARPRQAMAPPTGRRPR